MSYDISGKKIAILVTNGFEQIELTEPMKKVRETGGEADIISLEGGKIQGFNHMEKADKFEVDRTVEEVCATDYNGLILPGGVHNPDALRTNKKAIGFVQDFFKQHKPVAAICHGPWMLAEADVLRGRKVTSWPSIRTDIENAGGRWTDEEVVVDEGLVTSRKPEDLEVFCDKMIEEFCEGSHEEQTV